jgi:lipoprotein-anchoring transpeptidase ErfK/SrfK
MTIDETVQSTSMKKMSPALLAGATFLVASPHPLLAFDAASPGEPTVVYAREPAPPPRPVRVASNLGGGFIEFLFGDTPSQGYRQQPMYQPQPAYGGRGAMLTPMDPQAPMQYQYPQQEAADPALRPFDPRYEKQLVDYRGKEGAGTIVVDTPNKFLYLVQGDGTALRYGIGVGRPGFTWSGVKTISAKREWPDWTPPAEMLVRRPDLPRHMAGGPDNPLGARAMYLGSSLYRIHGSNEPWTIGTNVSSGCIRMRNEDVIDLYGRVNVGTRVIVI